MAYIYFDKAWVCFLLGDLLSAIDYYKRAVHHATVKWPDGSEIAALCLNNMGIA